MMAPQALVPGSIQNQNFLQKLLGSVATIVFVLAQAGCGLDLNWTPGGSSTPNDPRPSGNVVVQGSFTGSSGQSTVTGTAIIFSTSNSYILRLEGLSVPSETGLTIQIYTSQSQVNLNLTASTGNQNYSVNNLPINATTFLSVSIWSTLKNQQYANAVFSR